VVVSDKHNEINLAGVSSALHRPEVSACPWAWWDYCRSTFLKAIGLFSTNSVLLCHLK